MKAKTQNTTDDLSQNQTNHTAGSSTPAVAKTIAALGAKRAAEFHSRLDRIVNLSRELAARRALEAQELAAVRDEHAPVIEELQHTLDAQLELAGAMALVHRGALYGSKKSATAAHCTHGFKTSTALQPVAGHSFEAAALSMDQAGLESALVTRAPAICKTAAKKLAPEVLAIHGLQLSTRERFFVKLKHEGKNAKTATT